MMPLLAFFPFLVALCGALSDQSTTLATQRLYNHENLNRRATITTELSTCGYFQGDPSLPRTANSGFNCRVDAANGLWGFCPTSVRVASDCGLAAACFDNGKCSKGCGILRNTGLATLKWWVGYHPQALRRLTLCSQSSSFSLCSAAILTVGIDQTYSYIACATTAKTDNYLLSPTAEVVATSTQPSRSGTSASSFFESQTHIPETTEGTMPIVSATKDPVQPETTSKEEDPVQSSSPNNTDAIIGGVLGGLALLGGFVIAAIYLLRRKQRAQENTVEFPATEVEPRWKGDDMHVKVDGWAPQELPVHSHQVGPTELAG